MIAWVKGHKLWLLNLVIMVLLVLPNAAHAYTAGYTVVPYTDPSITRPVGSWTDYGGFIYSLNPTAEINFTVPDGKDHLEIRFSRDTDGSVLNVLSNGTLVGTVNQKGTPLSNVMSQRIEVPLAGIKNIRLVNSGANGFYAIRFEGFAHGLGAPDTTPPTVPTGLSAVAGNGQAALSWTAVTTSDLSGYKVYRNGTYLLTVNKPAVTYTATGLTNGIAYAFQLSSVDATGNESAKTAAVSVTPLDTVPPVAPTGLSVSDGGLKANVSWLSNSESDLAGYNLYMDGTKNNPSLLTGTTRTVTGLTGGSTYVFRMSAVDTSSNESPLSNAVSVVIANVMSINFVPNKDSIVVQVAGGTMPYTVTWDDGTDTFSATKYTITDLLPDTVYTITVADTSGATVTQLINTGNLKAFNPTVLPNPASIFQQMIDSFGTAGVIGLSVIGGAVALGIMVVLGIWGWRLAKRWLASTK